MIKNRLKKNNIKISGMSCVMCVKTIEKSLKSINGIANVNVNLNSEIAHIEYNSDLVNFYDMKKAIENVGYQVIEISDEEGIEKKEEEKRNKNLRSKLIKIILGSSIGIPMMVLMFILPHSHLLSYILFAISIPLFIYLGFNIFKSALTSLRHKNLDMNVMYALGMGSAYISSVLSTFGVLSSEFMFYETPILLATFLNLGKYLESRAKGKTSQSIKKLMGLQPKTAIVIKEGKELKLPIKSLQIDDTVIVKPGEKIPIDGIVIEGSSYVDEAMITGEPIPNLKKKNDNVVGGTINKNSFLKIKTTKIGKNTVLSQIIKLVNDAQNSKAPIQDIADKIVSYFIPVVLCIAIFSFIFWYFIIAKTMLFSFSVFISVIVIACPCALGLATPTAITVGLGRGAELGILIKNSDALEISRKLTTIVCDKTGTLTKGKPEVIDMIPFSIGKDELLTISASVENNSQHPLAQAIVKKAKEEDITLKEVKDFNTIEGKGIKAKINENNILIGNRTIFNEHRISISCAIEKNMNKLENEGKTVILVSSSNKIIGIIAIADPIKQNTKRAVKQFKDALMNVIMITGDNSRTANTIASQIGINTVISEVLPYEKSKKVKELQENGEVVAFIGDGINDAPAIAQADVGIAIGSGTDIAMESGDIVLMKDDLMDAYYSIKLSKKVMNKIKQNLFWAFAYNTALIPIAAGLLSGIGLTLRPEFAGLAMAMSSVTVVTLSLLLKKFTPTPYLRILSTFF